MNMAMINTNTKAAIIEKNQPLTLSMAKTLVGKMIAICCKNEKTGLFNDYVDHYYINQVGKIKGSKGYVILDMYNSWSYRSLDGKTVTCPNFQTGEELTVYFIEL